MYRSRAVLPSWLSSTLPLVTRISRGKIRWQLEPADLYQLARRTVQDHRSLFAKAEVEPELLPGDGEAWVNGDPTRLAQVRRS